MSNTFTDNFLNFKSDFSVKTVVVAAAHDLHTLEAIKASKEAFNIKYKLIGDQKKIIEIAKEIEFDVLKDDIINCVSDQEAAKIAVSLIRKNEGDVLMKGLLETKVLLKEVVSSETGIKNSDLLSHVAVLFVESYGKPLFITDGGMIVKPDLSQKIGITKNLANFLYKMDIKKPKIAVVCASESVSEKISETVDASQIAKLAKDGVFGESIIEGPISFDIAINEQSAKTKKYQGLIQGDADAFVTPCINTGNILSKSLIYFANAKMAGVVLGAKCPIVLVSRGASQEEKLLSVAICLKMD